MLMTLQLNISYEPIRIISWQEAVILWVKDKVEFIETYDHPLRSLEINTQIPAVVRLTKTYHKHSYEVSLDKWHVYARDGWCCMYCGKKFRADRLTFDHVKPRARGGKTSWKNIVACCESCNQRKGNRTPLEAEMPLLRRPTRPGWMPWLLVKTIRMEKVPEQWLRWINWLRSDPKQPDLYMRPLVENLVPTPAAAS